MFSPIELVVFEFAALSFSNFCSLFLADEDDEDEEDEDEEIDLLILL
jgi:hypothetical protein